jgi:hypothetical protein
MYANPFGPYGDDFTRMYYNNNPDAAWWAYIRGDDGSRWNMQGTDNRSRWAQAQQGRYHNMYQGSAPSEGNQGFYDWLRNNQPKLENEYAGLAPSQRGDFSYGLSNPRARWVMG